MQSVIEIADQTETVLINQKLEKIRQLEKLLDEKLPWEKRTRMTIDILSSIICVLAKSLIKTQGYSVAARLLQRELRNLGKEDAKRFVEILGEQPKEKEGVKDALRLAAMVLGSKLGLFEKGIGLAECPYCEAAKKFNEPFIINAELEYSQGVLEGLVGDGFKLVETKKKIKGDKYCKYDVVENV